MKARHYLLSFITIVPQYDFFQITLKEVLNINTKYEVLIVPVSRFIVNG